jgi:hypothetical protein
VTSINKPYFHPLVAGPVLTTLRIPIVTACYRISVVASCQDVKTLKAIESIYYRNVPGIDNLSRPSCLHFFKGAGGFFAKEFAGKMFLKPLGLFYKPAIDRYFNSEKSYVETFKSNLFFASFLSLMEIAINPLDLWRTILQSGQKIKNTVPQGKSFIVHLYTGAYANGLKHFYIWMSFAYSGKLSEKMLRTYIKIDPYSLYGIFLRSFPQAFLLTLPIYSVERMKNELQCKSLKKISSSRYINAFWQIKNKYGLKGFYRGFSAKVIGNGCTMMTANILVALGKRHMQFKKDEKKS